jgi:hypothetical protein
MASSSHPDRQNGLLNGFLTVDFETDLLTNDFGTDNWDNDDSVLRDPDATLLKPVCEQAMPRLSIPSLQGDGPLSGAATARPPVERRPSSAAPGSERPATRRITVAPPSFPSVAQIFAANERVARSMAALQHAKVALIDPDAPTTEAQRAAADRRAAAFAALENDFWSTATAADQLIDSLPELMDLSMPTLPDAPFLNFEHVSTDDDWLLSECLQTEPEAGDLAQSNMKDDCRPSSNDVKATTVPTATGGVQKKVSRRRGPNCISFSDLQIHFDKSQAKGAELIGISPTMVKRIAKHNGIKEWPCKKRNVPQ